jgi:hypothetical protein
MRSVVDGNVIMRGMTVQHVNETRRIVASSVGTVARHGPRLHVRRYVSHRQSKRRRTDVLEQAAFVPCASQYAFMSTGSWYIIAERSDPVVGTGS